MKKYLILMLTGFILVLFNGCSDDSSEPVEIVKEEPKAEENSPPTIVAQSFEVEENTTSGTVIGTIEAQDAENNNLVFSMSPIEGLVLDSKNGTLTTAKGADFLDYETNASFEFGVTVSDGEGSAQTNITLNIANVEDGPLTNFEKVVVGGFKHQILSNSTEFPLYKWTTTAKIYSSGIVNSNIKAVTSGSISALNDLFTDGFKIEIVNDSMEANVQLYTSTIADMKKLWPDFGQVADDNPGLGGIATIGGGRIWIADYAQNITTMKHEMGHMIGLDHSPAEQCTGIFEENSIMCGGANAAGKDLTEFDRKIIEYYYHPEITNGLLSSEVTEKLTELMLLDRED